MGSPQPPHQPLANTFQWRVLVQGRGGSTQNRQSCCTVFNVVAWMTHTHPSLPLVGKSSPPPAQPTYHLHLLDPPLPCGSHVCVFMLTLSPPDRTLVHSRSCKAGDGQTASNALFVRLNEPNSAKHRFSPHTHQSS